MRMCCSVVCCLTKSTRPDLPIRACTSNRRKKLLLTILSLYMFSLTRHHDKNASHTTILYKIKPHTCKTEDAQRRGVNLAKPSARSTFAWHRPRLGMSGEQQTTSSNVMLQHCKSRATV
jgi:hypothetical protein